MGSRSDRGRVSGDNDRVTPPAQQRWMAEGLGGGDEGGSNDLKVALPCKRMKARSPQQKKRISLRKDRRNAYGESPHGARKSIPKNKRIRARKERGAARVAASDHPAP